jgi:DNA-binding MarR family transcriptional regulator
MDRTTLTANLKPLERRGLLESKVDPTDRRGRLLTLTEAGRTLLASALPIWTRTHNEIDARLEEDAAALRAGLRALA